MKLMKTPGSIISDAASLMWRCATCDGYPLKAVKPIIKDIALTSPKVSERIEPKKIRNYRQKICKYMIGEFLDSCGITRKNLLSKSKSWLPYIAIGLAAIAIVVAL